MQYPWLADYLLEKPGVIDNWQTEWGWRRFYVGDKLFAALCYDQTQHLVFVTVKLPPEEGELLRSQYADVIPGYYMNKVHWNSVKADGQVPEDVLRAILDHAWETGLRTLPKKKQAQLLESTEA